jgi:hypothetical protein
VEKEIEKIKDEKQEIVVDEQKQEIIDDSNIFDEGDNDVIKIEDSESDIDNPSFIYEKI